MTNRALQELAALNDAAASTVDQAARQRATEEARAAETEASTPLQVRRSDDQEAGFALPEALATGVAAGWLLGPAGGIALGIAQGILGKNAEQNALDAFAAEQDVISGASDIIGDELSRMEATARNADDLNQVSNMMTQKDAAFKFLTSASPRLQAMGQDMMTKLQDEMINYSDRQETQRVAREELEAQLIRELGQEQYDRFESMKVRFDNESRQYEDVLGATNIAMAALEGGTPAQLHAASVLINKALDPTGVVRTEEAQALGTLGSIFEKADVYIERLATGKSLLPQQRRDFQVLLKQIQDGAAEIQLAREARYLTELSDADVPQKYWDNFTLVESVPASKPQPIDDDSVASAVRTPVIDAAEATVEGASSALDAAQSFQERARQSFRRFQEKFLKQPGRPTN